ncbi:hypothetical protein [Vibrio owensii]|uniref:hypothetical protein n=1 Tax=Vibrio owensii TaxID=696485 RepID=UPI003CC52487
MYTLVIDEKDTPLYLAEHKADMVLTTEKTDQYFEVETLAEALIVQNGHGLGTVKSPKLSPEVFGMRTRLAKVEIVVKGIQIDEETDLGAMIHGSVKVLNAESMSLTVNTAAPYLYTTTSAMRAMAKENRDQYSIVKVPKAQELNPQAGDAIYCFSAYSATGFNNLNYKLIEPANTDELNENLEIDLDRYDYFIAERL